MFKNQTIDNFVASSKPKYHGTMNLDRISRVKCPELQHFVLFSSITCGYGNVGQTNYGMFNAVGERICQRRRHRENLPGLAIEWGAVGNVGIFVSIMDGNTNESYSKYEYLSSTKNV